MNCLGILFSIRYSAKLRVVVSKYIKWLVSLELVSICALMSLVWFQGMPTGFLLYLLWSVYSLVKERDWICFFFFLIYYDHHYQLDSSAWSAAAVTGWMNHWMNDTCVCVVSFSFWLNSNGTPVYLHQWWLFDSILHQLPAAICD